MSRSVHRIVRPLIIFWTGGEVKLRSANPFDHPIVNPNFLSTDFDIQTIVAAIKLARRFTTAQAWQGFVGTPWEPLASANTDEEIVQYARNYSSTYVDPVGRLSLRANVAGLVYSVFHAVGTAAISQRGAPWGVLDPDLRVKGTKGLRVVDASALPYVPSAHSKFTPGYEARYLTLANSTRPSVPPRRGCRWKDKGGVVTPRPQRYLRKPRPSATHDHRARSFFEPSFLQPH